MSTLSPRALNALPGSRILSAIPVLSLGYTTDRMTNRSTTIIARLKRISSERGRAVSVAALAALTLFSAYCKAVNQFNFFIYPDSYYYLLVARNLLLSHHPTGTLGPGGMPFPPPGYAAMKTTFPLITAIVMSFGTGVETAGHLVSAVSAVLAVPLAYLAVWRLMRSRPIALAGAVLVATSYGLTYWAGFVMSDSLSVALGFAVIAALARERSDELTNPGDILVGVLVAFWLLSRSTYLVAIPFLLWLGFRMFGWTWKRTATAAAACLTVVAGIAAAWFPPSTFSSRLVLNLLPVLAAAAAATAVGFLVVRRRRPAPGGADERSPTARSAYWLLAGAIPAAFLLQWAIAQATGSSPFLALHRFGIRDAAALIAILPGAAALRLLHRREVGFALLSAALVMLGVYYWVEPRDSRYLVHLLPFLVPVAACSVALLSSNVLLPSPSTGHARRQTLLRRGTVACLVAIVAAVGAHASAGVSRASAAFLDTDYPREVAAGLRPIASGKEILVCALPWPLHFRLGVPAWSAPAAAQPEFPRYVPSDTPVLVLCDAAMHYHYPQLDAAVTRAMAGHEVLTFEVPSRYLYGYVAVDYSEPVRVYRMTAGQLRSLALDSSLEAGDSQEGVDAPFPVR
jgi:hypothetical protein